MKKYQGFRKIIICIAVAAAVMIPSIFEAGSCTAVHAADTAIRYQNSVFTKKLYQSTKKIGFGADGSQVAADKKTVKKIYSLLAAMELKAGWKKEGEPKCGFVTVVIYKNNGTKKTFTFQGNRIGTVNAAGRARSYTILDHHPIAEIQKIYEAF